MPYFMLSFLEEETCNYILTKIICQCFLLCLLQPFANSTLEEKQVTNKVKTILQTSKNEHYKNLTQTKH